MILITAALLGSAPQAEPPVADRVVAAYYHHRAAGSAEDHRRFAEMGRAGVDVAIVIPHGGAGPEGPVKALKALEKERKAHPRVAVFVDAGKGGPDAERMREAVRSFLAPIPARFRAEVDGRPVVWLGPVPPGFKFGQKDLSRFSELCRADFNGRAPYVVAETSWRGLKADRTYAWGSSRKERRGLSVATTGPGRGSEREKQYRRSWYVAHWEQPEWVVIESWNGEIPDDGVCETEERGRGLLDATEVYVRKFRNGTRLDPPTGKFTGEKQVAYSMKYNPVDQGLRPVEVQGGRFRTAQLRGIRVLTTRTPRHGSTRFVAFDVDDSWSFLRKRSVRVAVEFWDIGEGAFSLEYDSDDRRLKPAARRVKPAGTHRFEATGRWKRVEFELPDALFGNGQEGGADFRIRIEKRGVMLRLVMVSSG